jgi:hypothetical protein
MRTARILLFGVELRQRAVPIAIDSYRSRVVIGSSLHTVASTLKEGIGMRVPGR